MDIKKIIITGMINKAVLFYLDIIFSNYTSSFWKFL